MAAAARPSNLLLSLILFLYLLMSVNALYLPSPSVGMVARKVVVSTQADGNVTVVDSDTRAAVPQGPASDGSTSPSAVVWMGFCFVVGVPMAAAGIRGWRLTTGVGVGISAGVLSWAAIINSVNEEGLPDLILTVVVMAFSFMGFVLGVFEFARIGAMVLLCINGGLAFGLRVALIKEGLLIDDSGLFFLNWLVVGAFGGIMALTMIWHQRAMLLLACASVGTFLVFLGVDLLMNKEDGLSRGLRFIFDRNSSHLVDILSNGYRPALSTRINVYVSLGVTPILAYAQHRLFRAPFRRGPPPPSDAELSLNYPTNVTANRISGYLSGIWDRKKFQDASPNRFSL